MKNVIITTLFASGLLFGASNRLSYEARLALETQSPRVHVDKDFNKNGNMNSKSEDKIVVNKSTIVAHIPFRQQ